MLARSCLLAAALGLAGCAVGLAPPAREAPDAARTGAFRVEPAVLAETDSLPGSYYRLTAEAGGGMLRFYGYDLGGADAVAGWLEELRGAGAALEAAYFAAGSQSCGQTQTVVPPQLVLRLRAPWPDAPRHGFEPGRAMTCRDAALRFTPAARAPYPPG